MEEWKPIERRAIDVEGVDPHYSGLLRVVIQLSDCPPPGWREIFEDPPNVSISYSMHPPHLRGDEVVIRPPDGQVEEYVKHVDERIKATNEWYAQQVLPRVHREQEQQERAKVEEKRRLEEAREKLRKV